MKKIERCQVCNLEASWNCIKCQNMAYCSKEHQIQHWKNYHKNNCIKQKISNQYLLDQLIKKRYKTRQKFYQNYRNKIFNICILDAKVMVYCDRKIKILTKDLNDQYQYGASVCLLCRVFYIIGDKISARMVIQSYLFQQNQFLIDIEKIPNANQNIGLDEKQILLRKMSLISTIGNLCYMLQLQCIKYYVIYTKCIEKAFGKVSAETSNCYFLMGCFFAEEGYFKKAIACFMRAASFRGQLAGDCYYNVGILCSLQNEKLRAFDMFELAFHLRMEQYGEGKDPIAQVLQNQGITHFERNDFYAAYVAYNQALKIRLNNNEPTSKQCQYAIALISELYDKICLYLDDEEQQKKKGVLLQLKNQIESSPVFARLLKLSIKQGQQKKTSIQKIIGSKQKQKKESQSKQQCIQQNANLIISNKLLQKLSSEQLFELSDLQLQLSTTTSIFSKIYMIGQSRLLSKISQDNFNIIKNDNLYLFKGIRLEGFFKQQKFICQKNGKSNQERKDIRQKQGIKKIFK